MKEQAVQFGESASLSGILCQPDKPRPNAPAVLLWNVGIHHRVGAYRIWVDVARHLAAEGFTSLRFDLSGMGDSSIRRSAEEDVERRLDLDDAMAFVTKRTGITTFAPMGFCSGVDQLHTLGMRDPRVVAMAYIESYVWKTKGHYLRYPLRYLRSTLWSNRLEHLGERRAFRNLKGFFRKSEKLAVDPNAADAAAAGGADMFARQRPTQEQFSTDLKSLQQRGVKLFFAYFGLETGFTHRGQFQEMTGIAPSTDLQVFFLGGADHILLRTADRAQVVHAVGCWLTEAFPVGRAAA